MTAMEQNRLFVCWECQEKCVSLFLTYTLYFIFPTRIAEGILLIVGRYQIDIFRDIFTDNIVYRDFSVYHDFIYFRHQIK